MKTRVVSIISRMNVGGPAVLLGELIPALPPESIEHILITGRCEASEIDYIDLHPVQSEVIYIDQVGRSVLLVNDFVAFLKLVKILWSLKPDVIHTHTSKAGVLGRLAGKLVSPRSKIIHTFHGHLLYGYFSPSKTKIIILLEKYLAAISDLLITVTHQVQQDLLNAKIGVNNKWLLIRPGVSKPKVIQKELAKRNYGIPVNRPMIAWIGRFTSIKDPLGAICAFQELSKTFDATLVMAGDGELFSDCSKYIDKHNLDVKLLGWIADVNELLSASDLLLMTSLNEGMPVVIVEAAMHKVPTISTNVGGVNEFIKDVETGFMMPLHSNYSEFLAKAITNPELTKSVGLGAYNLATQNFSKANFVQQHVDVYLAK